MANDTPQKKAAAKPRKSAGTHSAFVNLLQQQVNTDIQAVKAGAIDEELLRARLVENIDPSSAMTQLSLWLCALANGVVDDLAVIVGEKGGDPTMDFLPIMNSLRDVKAPLLRLPLPGPESPVSAVAPYREPDVPCLAESIEATA